MKLTPAAIRSLTLPRGVKERTYFDDATPGFGLRLREGGSRTYIAQYKLGSKTRRFNLGSTALLDLTTARANAKDILARVRLGEDPHTEKAEARVAASETFGKYLDEYLRWKQPQVRPNSFREIARYLRQHAASWHPRQLATLAPRDAADLVDELTKRHGAPSANRAKAALSPYFDWLFSKGRVDDNVFAFTPKAQENGSRKRVLADPELAAIWHACNDSQGGAIVRLLMLTAARRTEIGSLSWSEIVGDLVTIPEERSKNSRPHEIPLSAPAREVLDGQPRRNSTDFVFGRLDSGFSGWSKAKAELDDRLAATGVAITAPWTLHDVRRTIATNLAERLRVEPHIVEAVLGHVGVYKAGVAGVYNLAGYRDQKREALQRWADLLHTIITDSGPGRSQRPDPSSISHGAYHGRKLQAAES